MDEVNGVCAVAFAAMKTAGMRKKIRFRRMFSMSGKWQTE
jgi:hypothetical protein